jgi:head-tail adaptor
VKNINAGDLRHRITLNRATGTTRSPVGQLQPNYATVGSYYSLVECLGGSEQVNATQLKGVLKYRIKIRAGNGPVNPSDKVVWNGHTIHVESSVTDPFGIMIEIDGTEKMATQ